MPENNERGLSRDEELEGFIKELRAEGPGNAELVELLRQTDNAIRECSRPRPDEMATWCSAGPGFYREP